VSGAGSCTCESPIGPLVLVGGPAGIRALRFRPGASRPCGAHAPAALRDAHLAGRVGRPDRVREVAGAVARTPAPILVACHRVVAADGSLAGHAGGLWRKRALLDFERRVCVGSSPRLAFARQLALPGGLA
jgi:O-6-methylguanine DNA methyltransferase